MTLEDKIQKLYQDKEESKSFYDALQKPVPTKQDAPKRDGYLYGRSERRMRMIKEIREREVERLRSDTYNRPGGPKDFGL